MFELGPPKGKALEVGLLFVWNSHIDVLIAT